MVPRIKYWHTLCVVYFWPLLFRHNMKVVQFLGSYTLLSLTRNIINQMLASYDKGFYLLFLPMCALCLCVSSFHAFFHTIPYLIFTHFCGVFSGCLLNTIFDRLQEILHAGMCGEVYSYQYTKQGSNLVGSRNSIF
jgi:hypothetical protein